MNNNSYFIKFYFVKSEMRECGSAGKHLFNNVRNTDFTKEFVITHGGLRQSGNCVRVHIYGT